MKHIDESNEKIERDKILDVVKTEPKQFQLVLYSIIQLCEKQKEEPVFKTVGQKAIFVLPNENNLNYSIRVLDAEGEQLFATNENASTIKKMFDFSNVEAGRYQILVSSNKSDYSFDFVNQR